MGNRTKRKKKKGFDRFLLVCALAFFVALFVDLATKAWAEYYFTNVGKTPIELIPHFMRLTLQYNSGVAFSFLDDNKIAMTLIVVLTPVIALALAVLVYFLPGKYNHYRFIISVIIAGIMGNFFDRVFVAEGVRDFMDVSSIGFGVCNFADYFISFGGVILVFCLLFVGEDAVFSIFGKKRKKKDENRKEKEE